jgi:hypothetical protein
MSDSRSLSVQENQALSDAQLAFCALVADCVTIKEACARMSWSADVYRRMREQQPAFDQAVLRAREMAQDTLVDKMHEIAATEPDVNRARLKVDTIKWTASKIKPRMYGDKLDITLEHRIDIGDALAAARARVVQLRPMCDPADVIEGEIVAAPSVEPAGAVDKQSTPALPDIFN